MSNIYLINKVLAKSGDSLSVSAVKSKLAELGYNRYQQIGCLGGCVTNNVILIENGMVTRL